MIPDNTALTHTFIGEYRQPSKDFPNGRLSGGGHTAQAMAEMDRRGLLYNVVRTDSNGVIFGNVPGHDQKFKKTGENQTWFPKTWAEHDIMSAGIATANKGTAVSNYAKEYVYKNINVRILITNGRISTICPSNDQPQEDKNGNIS